MSGVGSASSGTGPSGMSGVGSARAANTDSRLPAAVAAPAAIVSGMARPASVSRDSGPRSASDCGLRGST